jgi:hypothetical protein
LGDRRGSEFSAGAFQTAPDFLALAMTLLKLLPDGVQATGPAASSTPLFERRRTLHGSRLPFQHIQVAVTFVPKRYHGRTPVPILNMMEGY